MSKVNNNKKCPIITKNVRLKIVSLGDIPLGISIYTNIQGIIYPLCRLMYFFELVTEVNAYFYIHYIASIIRKHFSLEIILFVTSKADKY